MPEGGEAATILAFDFGLGRIGVAVGQRITGSATPLGVVANRETGPDWEAIGRLVREWQPSRLVVGMPAHADGRPAAISARAGDFARGLRRLGLPVDTIDERYSSLEARERLVASRRRGLSGRIRREMVDAAAAVVIAERWLAGESGQ